MADQNTCNWLINQQYADYRYVVVINPSSVLKCFMGYVRGKNIFKMAFCDCSVHF